MNMRLVSADAVKEIICKYEKRAIQHTMIFEIENMAGCAATQEQIIEISGDKEVVFEN